MQTFVQAPEARLDYAVNWAPFIDALDGDTIASAEWVEIDDGLVIEDEQLALNVHSAFFSGGQAGRAYRATSRITTTQGRTTEQTLTIYIRRT